MKRLFIYLFLTLNLGCKFDLDNDFPTPVSHSSPFQLTEFQEAKYPLNIDSLCHFLGITAPYSEEFVEKYNSMEWVEAKTPILDYQPMNFSYFMDQNEKKRLKERIISMGSLCYLVMMYEPDVCLLTIQKEDIQKERDVFKVLKKMDRNEWIGQCGEFDVLANAVSGYFKLSTVTMNPEIQLPAIDYEKGHIITLVYSLEENKFYPIDITNNCYWELSPSGEIADIISILTGKEYYRMSLDTLFGAKTVMNWPFSIFPKYHHTITGFSEKYINIQKYKNGLIVRKHREPPKDATEGSYLYATSIVLDTHNPSWEDFLFDAGLRSKDGSVRFDRFSSDDKEILRELYNQINAIPLN